MSFPPITLPAETKAALQQIQGYLRTANMEAERSVQQEGQRVGYWQCTEWLEGLDQIVLAIGQLPVMSGKDSQAQRLQKLELEIKTIAEASAAVVELRQKRDARLAQLEEAIPKIKAAIQSGSLFGVVQELEKMEGKV